MEDVKALGPMSVGWFSEGWHHRLGNPFNHGMFRFLCTTWMTNYTNSFFFASVIFTQLFLSEIFKRGCALTGENNSVMKKILGPVKSADLS
jgi:hypothetical protein